MKYKNFNTDDKESLSQFYYPSLIANSLLCTIINTVYIFANKSIMLKRKTYWLVGLGVWFSLWVREVPGSNPGRALRFYFYKSSINFIIRFIRKVRGPLRLGTHMAFLWRSFFFFCRSLVVAPMFLFFRTHMAAKLPIVCLLLSAAL